MNSYERKLEELGGELLDVVRGKAPTVVSEEKMLQLETDVGHALPDDYRDFLRRYGGYKLRRSARFPLKNSGDLRGNISKFYGIFGPLYVSRDLLVVYKNICDSEWQLNIYSGLRMIRSEENFQYLSFPDYVWWPSELLPIGVGDSSNMTCLAITGEHTGKVYFLVNDAGTGEPNFYQAAESFREFIDSLEPAS